MYLSPAGDWQTRLWYSHHCAWACTERRNTLRLRQNPGKYLNKTPNIKDSVQLNHCLSSPNTRVMIVTVYVSSRAAGWVWRQWWRCWRPLQTLLHVWSAYLGTRQSDCRSWSVCKWYVTIFSTRFTIFSQCISLIVVNCEFFTFISHTLSSLL